MFEWINMMERLLGKGIGCDPMCEWSKVKERLQEPMSEWMNAKESV
jgi:hypothetical protein